MESGYNKIGLPLYMSDSGNMIQIYKATSSNFQTKVIFLK